MNFECDVSVKKPYPPLMVSGENQRYAGILMRLYAGRCSELTTVDQYIYQNIVLGDKKRDIASVIECIAIVEMRHFKMLGELIRLLGVNPKIMAPSGNRRGSYWSGEYVSYQKDLNSVSLCDILQTDLESEKYAIKDYTNAIAQIEDIYIQDVLERIIVDEKHHVEIFEGLILSEC